MRRHRSRRGQTMVELALVFPLFVMVLMGIIVLGIGVFYQQQVTNAAREAARYAAIHSATAINPTVSWLDPDGQDGAGVYGWWALYTPQSYTRFYDRPEDGWPHMTAAARQLVFGLDRNDVNTAACWSGYRAFDGSAYAGAFDAHRRCRPRGTTSSVPSTAHSCSAPSMEPIQSAIRAASAATLLSRRPRKTRRAPSPRGRAESSPTR